MRIAFRILADCAPEPTGAICAPRRVLSVAAPWLFSAPFKFRRECYSLLQQAQASCTIYDTVLFQNDAGNEELVSETVFVLSEPLAVRPASRARIDFSIDSPPGAELIIEHLRDAQLLAREARPLMTGATSLEINTHPDATHVACLLRKNTVGRHVISSDSGRRLNNELRTGGNDTPINDVRFSVYCGERIEPVPRHFIIIGAMKAGTTTLYELLARHPALCRTWAHLPGVSFTKEINYFTRQYRPDHTPLHYDWRFPFDSGRHAWTLDASPNYSKWPMSKDVPERIASLGGETKLAYILREPVDRIESQMAHTLVRKGQSSLRRCIRVSSYALQLDKFMPHIIRDNVLLLDFEKLRRNPSAVVAQVCDFLGIQQVPASRAVHNRGRSRYRLSNQQRADVVEALRPDVERLISEYGFSPAERWLRKPLLSRLRLPGFRA